MIRFSILYDPNFCIFLKQRFKRDIILEAIYHN